MKFFLLEKSYTCSINETYLMLEKYFLFSTALKNFRSKGTAILNGVKFPNIKLIT